uniref:RING-type domain-containing protein n=1 Tax=Oryza glumipatula TaxID=40148 RepID=A0A0D9YWF6_9ORYZ
MAAAAAAVKEEDDSIECAVCLAELEEGDEARFLPRCGHGFHAECVDMWLGSHSTCPRCRLTVIVSSPPLLSPVTAASRATPLLSITAMPTGEPTRPRSPPPPPPLGPTLRLLPPGKSVGRGRRSCGATSPRTPTGPAPMAAPSTRLPGRGGRGGGGRRRGGGGGCEAGEGEGGGEATVLEVLDDVSEPLGGDAAVVGEEVERLLEAGHHGEIAAVVLNHPSSALTPASTRSLSASLLAVAPSLPTPVADSVLKLLWHHAPRALLFFHSLLHLPPRAHAVGPSTLDLALDLSARLRRPRQLTNSILGLFPRHRLAFTPRTFPILFERLAVSQRRPDLAVRLFLSLHRSHRVAQDLPLFNSLLDALSKSRHAGKAASLVRALEQRFTPDVVTYNTLADGWCRVKDTSRALDVLRLMVESGIAPTKTTYNIILKGFFRAGQLRHAWDFFLQMKKRGSKDESSKPDVVSYTTMVHGLGVAGQLEKARKVFDEMAKEGCAPSVATYNALIQVICKKGNVEDAVTVFDGMLVKGYVPNVVTYTVLIRGLCHAGKIDRGLKLLERMKNGGCEPIVQTYNVLIRYLFEEGEMEKGLDLFEKMSKGEECLPNQDTYNIIISAMFMRKRAEDMVLAARMVEEMVDRGYLPRRFMFNRVLNGLMLTGNQELSRKLLRMQEKYRLFERAPTEIFSLSLLVQLQFGMIGSKAVYQMIYGDWKVLATVSRKSQSTATAPCLAISLKVGVFGVRVLQGHRAPVVIDLAKSILIFPGADHVDALLKKTDRASEHLYICTDHSKNIALFSHANHGGMAKRIGLKA